VTVSAADVAELRRLAAELPENGADNLQALHTVEELFAYVVALARAEGLDEADAIELFTRAARSSRDDLRRAAVIMGRLGYNLVSDRLRKLARRKTLS
jgi:hypothetical protein